MVGGIVLLASIIYMIKKSKELEFLEPENEIFFNLYKTYENLEKYKETEESSYKDLIIKSFLKISHILDQITEYKQYYNWISLNQFNENAQKLSNSIKERLLYNIQSMDRSSSTKIIAICSDLLLYFYKPDINSLKSSVKTLEDLEKGEFKRRIFADEFKDFSKNHTQISGSISFIFKIAIGFIIVFGISYFISIFFNYDFNVLIPYAITGGAALSAALVARKIFK